MLFRPRGGEVECVFQNTIGAGAREHGVLCDEFSVGAGVHAATHGRVFAFGIFAHHPKVDVAGLTVGERAFHAGHQAHRAQVDVLIVAAAKRYQQAPQ